MKSKVYLGLLKGAKGNKYNLTFEYMDNCRIEDVKKHVDWSVFSNIQKYGYADTSTIDEKILIQKTTVSLNMS